MNPTLRRRAGYVWSGALALAGAATAVLLGLNELNLLPKGLRVPGAGLVVAFALMSAVEGAYGIARRRGEYERDKLTASIQKALAALLVDIIETVDHADLVIQDLGASLFVPRRRGVARRWMMVRVLRFRLNDAQQPTRVRWTKGKGAVGTCWEKSREIHRDWRIQRTTYGDPELALDDFLRMPAHLRDGFSYEEFVAIAAKYSEVLAVPILSEGGATLGVLSIDVAPSDLLTVNVLDTLDVKAKAVAAASLLPSDKFDQMQELT